jgi:steroid delta-isomerase-like uncharacterized protein
MTQLTEQEVRQMTAVVNTHNVDKVVEQYADNATFQVPSLDAPLRGKDAIRAYLSNSFAAFPDWTMDITKVFISGGETVVLNSVRGTQTGPLAIPNAASIPPTNRKFVQDQMTHIVLNSNGKVQSLRSYGNPAQVSHQLGLPTSATP